MLCILQNVFERKLDKAMCAKNCQREKE